MYNFILSPDTYNYDTDKCFLLEKESELLSRDTEEGSETTNRIESMLEQVFKDINSKVRRHNSGQILASKLQLVCRKSDYCLGEH